MAVTLPPQTEDKVDTKVSAFFRKQKGVFILLSNNTGL